MSFENSPKLQCNLNPGNNWTNSINLAFNLQFDPPAYVKFISTPACLISVEGLSIRNYEISKDDGKEYLSNEFVTSEDMAYQIENATVKQLTVIAKPQPEYINQDINLIIIFLNKIPNLLTP